MTGSVARHAKLAAASAATALLAGVPAQAAATGKGPRSEETASKIDSLFADALAARAMPGASVAIVYDDGRIVSKHFGSASLEAGVRVTGQTRFRIGSISKLITALAILKLAEQGRLRLDAPVARLVAGDARIARLPPTVTVRRLLNHTSGLADFTSEELEAMIARGIATDADLDPVLARRPAAEPGREWSYADAPFRILSHVIEKASGLSYGRYVSERLAPALGLGSLRLCAPGSPEQARGYVSRDRELRPEAAYAIDGLLGEGGLCATAEDLARLPSALKDGKWIAPAGLAGMIAPTRLLGGELIDYGLGTRRGLLGRQRMWGHTGGGPDGSWAALAHYPERRVTVAVVANGTGSETDAATLQAAIAAALFDEGPPASLKAGPPLLRTLAGAYERRGRMACLVRRNGGLVRTDPSAAKAPVALLYQGRTLFARNDYPLDRIEFQVERRRALGYRVYYDGFFAEYWRRNGPGSQPSCSRSAAALEDKPRRETAEE